MEVRDVPVVAAGPARCAAARRRRRALRHRLPHLQRPRQLPHGRARPHRSALGVAADSRPRVRRHRRRGGRRGWRPATPAIASSSIRGATASARRAAALRVLRDRRLAPVRARTREHGITGLPGALAEFITVPAVNAISVEPALPNDDAGAHRAARLHRPFDATCVERVDDALPAPRREPATIACARC